MSGSRRLLAVLQRGALVAGAVVAVLLLALFYSVVSSAVDHADARRAEWLSSASAETPAMPALRSRPVMVAGTTRDAD